MHIVINMNFGQKKLSKIKVSDYSDIFIMKNFKLFWNEKNQKSRSFITIYEKMEGD